MALVKAHIPDNVRGATQKHKHFEPGFVDTAETLYLGARQQKVS